ncbi:MAG TPA: serine hydrolase domain-containing protein [Gemmataceae bacterium]|nr:serine hydrolase domain-containing protein [Gemmataceae bacterium]
MRSCPRFLFLLPLLLAAPHVRADNPKPIEAPKTFDLRAIDAYVADQVRAKGYPGLALAIVRDGKVVLAKGYGRRSLASDEPVEPDTPLAIGSVTKQFTCACILLLAEEGKLSIEDRVAKYYPDLTRARDITLYDLMTHTSGYPDYYPLDFVDRRMRKPCDIDRLLAEYAGGKLDFEPGTRWSYSNTGFLLLGRVIEKVSKEPMRRFLERRILEPLGMKHSMFEPGSEVAGLAQGYTSFALGPAEPSTREAEGWVHAAGGLWASASDLARWDLALMEGKVLKPESYRLLSTRRKLQNGKTKDYGCGMGVIERDGETILTHSGAVSGFMAFNALVPRTKSAVILLTNSEHLDPGALHQTILSLLLKDQTDKEAPEVPKVHGPSAKDAALDFFHQMQAGKVDRGKLSEEFSIYLTDERLKSAAPRLKALGEPDKIEVQHTLERGGMEVTLLRFTFKDAVLKASLYRTPDGKIQQLLFSKG